MDNDFCKATIDVGEARITIEGPAEFVQKQVRTFAGLHSNPHHEESEVSHSVSSIAGALTEKQLVAAKRPKGHHEIATVLAFALTEAGVKEFTEDEIRRAYIRADVRPPKFVSQALRDAKSKFDYIETGSKRGTYRLTNHGDRTVRFDLPRQ